MTALSGHYGNLAGLLHAFDVQPAEGAEVLDRSTGLRWMRCPLGMGWDGSRCTGTATTHLSARDAVQAAKAGLLEVADVFVVNKADREGADRLVQSIAAVLALQPAAPGAWHPPIQKTEATTGAGVSDLLDAIERFRAQSADARSERLRARHDARLRDILTRQFLQAVQEVVPAEEHARLVEDLAQRRLDPYTAAADIAGAIRRADDGDRFGRQQRRQLAERRLLQRRKERRVIHRLQQRAPFDPARALFIDDSLSVLRAARDYGIGHLLTIAQPDSRLPAREGLEFVAVGHFAELLPIPAGV